MVNQASECGLFIAPEWAVQVFREATPESQQVMEGIRYAWLHEMYVRGLQPVPQDPFVPTSVPTNLMFFHQSDIARDSSARTRSSLAPLTGEVMADEFAALLDGSDSVLQAPPDGLYYDQAGDNTEFGIFFGKSETSKDTTNIIRDALGKMSILDHGWLPRIKSAHVTFGCVIGWGDEVSSAIDRALTATEYPRAPLEFGELIIKHNQVGRVDEVNTNRTKPTHPTSATSISDWIS